MFTLKDREQFILQGVDIQHVENQIVRFKAGFPFIDLVAPATVGHGIIRLDETQVESNAGAFDMQKSNLRLLKFVPASGAATRMFKDLFEFSAALKPRGFDRDRASLEENFPAIAALIAYFHRLPFVDELRSALSKQGRDLDDLLGKSDYQVIMHYILDRDGINYAALPKGLLSFHRYPDETRTAMEEHLVEGADYCRDGHGNVCLHFTVSPEHLEAFRNKVDEVKGSYEKRYGVTYHVDFSVQKSSTDTLAVDLNNEPFRNFDGSLLFRPAGHGALIENLNDLDADIIFIKNIDNVVPDYLKPENTLYKKALAGYLLNLRQEVYTCLGRLQDNMLSEHDLNEIALFAMNTLLIDPSFLDSLDHENQRSALFNALHRPIRVCGMVKNVGEPGGGPFWVKDRQGRISLQIVESSQVNMSDPKQKEQFLQATHFNPVDLVCSVKDHQGKKFDLSQFVDPSTGFISRKSKDGRELKAMELPGLWNGAMAGWITIFAEVPLITFNPVKTVNDLLRKEHQVNP
ncbi:MAG: DUF4301 family protein [Bacteroidales bacterium]|nr:DUF4301 family protein [Bacteroidales bacterium]